jgi:DNA mismatch repair ATPase MutS
VPFVVSITHHRAYPLARPGTSPTSGIALLASALEYLVKKESTVVCTTHFLELFSMSMFTSESSGVRAMRMSIRLPEDDDELATPLFRLEEGVASSSAGLVCAKLAGVRTSVLDRAGEIISAVRDGRQVAPVKDVLMHDLRLSDSRQCLLGKFALTDWTEASDEDVDAFLDESVDIYGNK